MAIEAHSVQACASLRDCCSLFNPAYSRVFFGETPGFLHAEEPVNKRPGMPLPLPENATHTVAFFYWANQLARFGKQ